MKRSAKVSGAKQFARLLRQHPREIGREVSQVLRTEARQLAIGYGMATNPPSAGGGTAVENFKERIAAEIKTVYPTREDEAAVYRLLQKHAPELAKAYWHAFKSRKPHQMMMILRRAALPQGSANAGQLKQWRTGRRGRVDKRLGGAALVRGHEQRRIIRDQQALVGTAKAGWHQAAKGIGGRVRRNLVGADGKRSTAEAFPAYVRKVSRKFPGLGGAFMRPGAITIFTNVRHGVEALEPRLKADAEARAQENFQKAMAEAVSRVNEKYFGKAA